MGDLCKALAGAGEGDIPGAETDATRNQLILTQCSRYCCCRVLGKHDKFFTRGRYEPENGRLFEIGRTLYTAAVVSAALAFAPGAQANLLLNPGFETGDFTTWDTSGDTLVLSCASTFEGCAPDGGTFFGIINNSFGNGNGSVRQTVALPGPGAYSFGAYVTFATDQLAGNFDQGQISLAVQLPGGESATVGFDPNALNGQFTVPGGAGFSFTPWMLLSGVLTYGGAGPADALFNISVQDFSAVGGLALAFDNAFVEVVSRVPEPATLGLLATGLVGLGALGRRRRA